MPLASLFALQWYGPACGAMTDTEPAIEVELPIKGRARGTVEEQISLPVPFLKGTRLVNSPLLVDGLGQLEQALPKGRARGALSVSIGAIPSAFDIAQAVLNAAAASYNIPNTIGAKINSAGSGSSPQDIADAVLDANLDDHQTAGSVGKKIKDGLKTSDFIALK